ncbi:MAG: hypothetical protein SGILL_002076 [Bacillariaceae sp.]
MQIVPKKEEEKKMAFQSTDNNMEHKVAGSYRKLRTSDVDVVTKMSVDAIGMHEDEATVVTAASTHVSSGKEASNMAPTTTSKAQTMSTMRRLFELARPERHLIIFSGISMALGSAVSLAVPTYAGRIIDLSIAKTQEDDGSDESGSSPFSLLMSLLGIMTLSGIVGFFRIWWQATAGHRLVARLRRQLYTAILSQDAAYFDSVQQGDLISRLSSDADLVQSAVTEQALGLLRNVVIAIGAIALLFYTSASLALVSVSILPPIALCARMVGRQMKDRQKRVRELHAEATSLAEQALTCIRTVQQFVAEPYEVYQYNQAVNQAHAEGIQNTKYKAMFGSAMQLVVNLALLVVLGYGGMQVQRGILSPGDLTSFVMYSVMMGGNVSGISTQYIDLMKAVAAANRVFDIVDREPPIPPPQIVEHPEDEILVVKDRSRDGQDSLLVKSERPSFEMMELGMSSADNTQGEVVPKAVQFDHVSFSYPSRPESKILNDLNLSIQAGQSVALVGNSGGGKSTLASLLTRLYDPQDGDIRIDNEIVRDMRPEDVRRNVGIVVQEPLLFPTTIEANIRYGTPNATDEQVKEAARLAYVMEFAEKFSDGLQTVVGPRGTQLSGGQKQRVAVARCILKNPPIVVFDEATSALDAESEFQVQKAIDIACKGRTVIMIAHRLSTIRNADSIAVLQNGRVAEMGPFDELMERTTGPFRVLMEKQLFSQ